MTRLFFMARLAIVLALSTVTFTVSSTLTQAWAAPAKDGLSIGGYFTQSLNLVDIDDRDGRNFEDEVLTQNGEIHFKARKNMKSGAVLEAHVQLEAASEDDQIDEHYISVSADWGRLLIGAENGVGHLMQVRAPSFVPGLKMYDNSLTDESLEDAFNLMFDADLDDDMVPKILNDAHMSTKLEHISGDANKLSFITPKVGGLQLGVSFTPNNRDRGGSAENLAAVERAAEMQEDIIEVAMSYSGRLGGVKYKFGYSDVEGDSLSGDNPESQSAGLRIAWADYVIGLNQSTYNDLDTLPGNAYGEGEIETQNFGFRKGSSKAQWGIGFTQSEHSDSNGVRVDYEEIMIGGGRKLTEGVRLGYYYSQSEVSRPNETGDARSGEISSLGMTIDLRF